MAEVYDDTICLLGEGPLWHPERGELFWFDILGKRLHRKGQHWSFDRYISAAGWVDADTLLVASQTALSRFTISTGVSEDITPLEADNPVTRSNDGRADPWGGFWIGTMGINGEAGAGSIWRYYRGELRLLVSDVTTSNAICFAPDRSCAYYTDTPTKQIMRQPLDADHGWPTGAPSVLVDLTATPHKADGAVVDADGTLWTAQWGSGRIAGYAADGSFTRAFDVPALQSTCPAFGGPDLSTLFCTSAAVGLSQSAIAERPQSGCTFTTPTNLRGQPEPKVIL